jgi:hypothetical protein
MMLLSKITTSASGSTVCYFSRSAMSVRGLYIVQLFTLV